MHHRERVFSPVITLLMFCSVLVDRCCRAAVSRVVAAVAAGGSTPPSQETSASVRLVSGSPEGFFRKMLAETSQAADKDVSQEHLWLGHHRVLVADGSSAQLPIRRQTARSGIAEWSEARLGFPVAPFVGFFSLVTGILMHIVVGKELPQQICSGRLGQVDGGRRGLRRPGVLLYADMAMLKALG